MKVRFYDFSKRRNSLVIPSNTDQYTEVEVLLKDDTSVHDPVLKVAGGVNVSRNYVHIPDWGRYYFVRDIISVQNGVTEYVLTEDVLGSHKSEILATKARILYASGSVDGLIIDSRLISANWKHADVLTTGAAGVDSTGIYSLTVFNGVNSTWNGMGTTYLLDDTGMQALKEWLMSGTVYDDIRQFFNGSPLDAVFSCMWLPFEKARTSTTLMGTSVPGVVFGNQDMGASGHAVDVNENHILQLGIPYKMIYGDLDLLTGAPYTDFRRSEPFTSITLSIPFVGEIDVNLSDVIEQGKIHYDICQDYVTGSVEYTLYAGTSDTGTAMIQDIVTQAGSQCPLGQIMTNTAGQMQAIKTGVAGMLSAAAGYATANPIMLAGGIGAAVTAASNLALASNQRTVITHGAAGGRCGVNILYMQVNIYYLETEDPTDADYLALRGRPCMGVHLIGGLGDGYYQCDDASVNIAGSSE